MDGGGKLLTAFLLVACGALGALVFSRDDAAPALPNARNHGPGELLVRRTAPPIALDLAQEPVVVPDAPDFAALTPSQAPAAGRPAAAIDARPQARLAAEFSTPSGLAAPENVDAFRMANEFAAPSSSWTESPDGRRPLNNLLSAPRLPERFPGAEFEAAPVAASPAVAAPPFAAPSAASTEPAAGARPTTHSRPTLGPPIAAGRASDNAAIVPGRMTPISSSVRSGEIQEAAPQAAVAGESAPPAVAAPAPRFVPLKRHTVRDGDTLADLSRRYYGDDSFAAALYEANRGVLASPELLPIGAVLTIPAREFAASGATSTPAAAGLTPAAVLVPKPEFHPFGAQPTGASAAASAQP